MKRGGRIARRKPIKRVNKARREQRFAKAFGPKANWIRRQDCVVPGCFDLPVEAAHAKSHGSGGTSEHLCSLCAPHHREQHDLGIRTFQGKHGIDLLALARVQEAKWREVAPSELRAIEESERQQANELQESA